jgi:hypothetical protein
MDDASAELSQESCSFLGSPALRPAAFRLDAELGRIAAMNIDELRDLWRQGRDDGPPEALSKDLIARALAHCLQEQCLGGLDPQVRKLLAALARKEPVRHLKAGSERENESTLTHIMRSRGLAEPRGPPPRPHSNASTCARLIAIQRQNTQPRRLPTPRKPRIPINRSMKVDSFSRSQGIRVRREI